MYNNIAIRIDNIYKLSDLYQKYVIDRGKLSMKKQLDPQITVCCLELNRDFLEFKGKHEAGRLSKDKYHGKLKMFQFLIQNAKGLDHTSLGSKAIIEEINRHFKSN